MVVLKVWLWEVATGRLETKVIIKIGFVTISEIKSPAISISDVTMETTLKIIIVQWVFCENFH